MVDVMLRPRDMAIANKTFAIVANVYKFSLNLTKNAIRMLEHQMLLKVVMHL